MAVRRTALNTLRILALSSAAWGGCIAQPAIAQQAGASGTATVPPASVATNDSAAAAPDASPAPTSATVADSGQTSDLATSEPTDAGGSDIIVTGTRLSNGMRTPTPVTVATADQLEKSAPNNISDALARLPSFGSTVNSTAPGSAGTTGNVGQNLLNLRGLGNNRNLVLLDGRRVVSNNQDFAVDINTLPSLLVSRVEVVTGGASAAYGSDAVAGVVNFILDTRFTGLKGQVSGGISTYGDADNRQFKLAYGGGFFGDRLHVVASGEYFKSSAIERNDNNKRKWFTDTWGLITNTVSSSPSNLVLSDIRSSIANAGGVITTGPLRGTQFLANGVPAPFNYGYSSGNAFQSGGDGEIANYGFTPSQERANALIHANLDLSDSVSMFGEFGYAYSTTTLDDFAQPMTGTANAFTIFSDNAYLTQATKTAMANAGITSFRLGRYMDEFPDFYITNKNNVFREAIGLRGKNLFGLPTWKWDITYSAGQSIQDFYEPNLSELRKLYAASDAVVNPVTGAIVCRSQYYTAAGVFVAAGTGADPGCVPLNVIGTNGPNPEAQAWINGTASKRLVVHQQVIEARLSGDFGSFKLGGGPISFAIGADYRRDSARQTADAISQAIVNTTGLRSAPASLNGKLGGWRFGNFQPFKGSQTVKEAFGELGIPILEDKPLASSLTLNLAGRYTSYSLAGDVQTWKIGLGYAPITDIRFRGTVSRDIRAPTLLELFNTAIQNTANVIYPSSTNGVTRQVLQTITGNPNLKPERALTLTYGGVLTPSFIPRLSLSVDYYNIIIKGAIVTLTAQQEVDFCAAGQQQFCQYISFNPVTNLVTELIPAVNLSKFATSGLDFELNYSVPLGGNSLGIRVLANHSITNYIQAPGIAPTLFQGGAQSPNWKAQAQLRYEAGGWGFLLNNRFISSVKMDPNKVEGVYTDRNRVPAIYYADLTITKDFKVSNKTIQFFLTVENLLNRDPPIYVTPPGNATNSTSPVYDRLGRYFTGGIRFKL